jgi:hypothetical protein
MERNLAPHTKDGDEALKARIEDCRVENGKLLVILREAVDARRAEDPPNYLVTINGSVQILPPRTVTYDQGSRTIRFDNLELRPGDFVTVTLIGLWDQNPYIPGPTVICHIRVPPRRQPRVVWFVLLGGLVLLAILSVSV